MKSSALVLAAGLSIFGASLGCDSAGDDAGTGGTGAGTSTGTGGKIAVGGTSTGTSGSTGTGGGSANDVSITWAESWVDVTSNPLGIQGAIFSYGDDTSKMGMMENFTGANACISGSAAKVDTGCTPVAPATDCYGTFWGAAIGLNLNQPKDAMDMGGTPVAYDASHISGFTFTLGGSVATGGTSVVPSTLRFKVEDANGEFCTYKTIGPGTSTVLFSELETECWNHSKKAGTPATTAQKGLIKIAWQVVTTTGGPTPFDFCVSDLHALTDGTTVAPVGTGGTSSGTAGTSSSSAGTTSSAGTSSAGTASTTGGGGAAAGGSGTGGASGGASAGSGGASGGSGGAKGGSGGTGGA